MRASCALLDNDGRPINVGRRTRGTGWANRSAWTSRADRSRRPWRSRWARHGRRLSLLCHLGRSERVTHGVRGSAARQRSGDNACEDSGNDRSHARQPRVSCLAWLPVRACHLICDDAPSFAYHACRVGRRPRCLGAASAWPRSRPAGDAWVRSSVLRWQTAPPQSEMPQSFRNVGGAAYCASSEPSPAQSWAQRWQSGRPAVPCLRYFFSMLLPTSQRLLL